MEFVFQQVGGAAPVRCSLQVAAASEDVLVGLIADFQIVRRCECAWREMNARHVAAVSKTEHAGKLKTRTTTTGGQWKIST